MRSSSTAVVVLSCGPRSENATVAPRPARNSRATTWAERAIAAGCDPRLHQQPLSSDGFAGEWLLVTDKAGVNTSLYPGKLPEELWDEVFIVLVGLGRLIHDRDLRPWHGIVLLNDSSPQALALRIKLVRDALEMDHSLFYGACGLNPRAGEALEAGHALLASPGHEMVNQVSAHYDIPEEWLKYGTAEEIELIPVPVEAERSNTSPVSSIAASQWTVEPSDSADGAG